MNSLPDTNIWLDLTFSAHPHHEKALGWFESMPATSCAFCRMTQQGYLRLASNPKVFGMDAFALVDSWKAYNTLQDDERVRFESEPVDIESAWSAYTSTKTFSAKVWNDAYLAAFAKQSKFQLVTFDRGFRQYHGLNLKLLR